jgi:hypothetical protein
VKNAYILDSPVLPLNLLLKLRDALSYLPYTVVVAVVASPQTATLWKEDMEGRPRLSGNFVTIFPSVASMPT